MDAMSVFVARKLVEMIDEKERAMLRPLIQGAAVDFPDYKKRAGYLEALGHVREWIEKINAEEDDQGRGPFARAS
ncbi:MAG TPA: hypothetical protein VGL12_15335 [Roseiarcus sp.]|jgi:hypothetical protein